MKLIPISEHPDAAKILYWLLEERPTEANISHKAMPAWDEHLAFIASEPYAAWYIVQDDGGPIGAAYLTKANEIGIGLLRLARGFGYGPQAVKILMDKHGGRRYLANINPSNEPSRKMFEKLGFELAQETYALEAE